MKFPNLSVGACTEYRTFWISNRFLAAVSCTWDLHKTIFKGSTLLNAACNKYASFMDKLMANANNGTPYQYWATHCNVLDCPKTLADVVESVIGAMFIDCDLNVRLMEKFILNKIVYPFEKFIGEPNESVIHPINKLLSHVSKEFSCKDFHLRSLTFLLV